MVSLEPNERLVQHTDLLQIVPRHRSQRATDGGGGCSLFSLVFSSKSLSSCCDLALKHRAAAKSMDESSSCTKIAGLYSRVLSQEEKKMDALEAALQQCAKPE